MIKIIWSDDFSSSEMAELIRDKFDISVSYFEEDYDFGVKIADWDYNSKILNFIKKKVGDVSIIEESKKSVRKSMKESRSSIRFEDFLNLNEESDEEYTVYVDDVKHGMYFKDEIFERYPELLSCDIVAWWVNNLTKNAVDVFLK